MQDFFVALQRSKVFLKFSFHSLNQAEDSDAEYIGTFVGFGFVHRVDRPELYSVMPPMIIIFHTHQHFLAELCF